MTAGAEVLAGKKVIDITAGEEERKKDERKKRWSVGRQTREE